MRSIASRWVRVASVILLGLQGAACALNDEISGQVDRLDRSVEQARNEAILKNVVRASEDKPLNFITIPTLHGSNSITSQVGLPEVIFGPHQQALTRIQRLAVFGGGMNGSGAPNTIGTTGTTTFDMTALESRDFYRGLLNPISPSTFALFQAQDVPREILFYLFVDRLFIKNNAGDHVYRNDPSDPGFPAFEGLVDLAVAYGLSFEVAPSAHRKAGAADDGCDAHDPKCAGGRGSEPRTRICFDPKLAQKPESEVIRAVKPICGAPSEPGSGHQGAVYLSANGPVSISGQPRSIFDVFQYLGRLVALGEQGLIHLKSEEAQHWGASPDDILFRVEHSGAAGCFVSVVGDRGSYCAPASGAANTSRIIGILAQLTALATSIADIPFTPTVHIAD